MKYIRKHMSTSGIRISSWMNRKRIQTCTLNMLLRQPLLQDLVNMASKNLLSTTKPMLHLKATVELLSVPLPSKMFVKDLLVKTQTIWWRIRIAHQALELTISSRTVPYHQLSIGTSKPGIWCQIPPRKLSPTQRMSTILVRLSTMLRNSIPFKSQWLQVVVQTTHLRWSDSKTWCVKETLIRLRLKTRILTLRICKEQPIWDLVSIAFNTPTKLAALSLKSSSRNIIKGSRQLWYQELIARISLMTTSTEAFLLTRS